MILFLSFLIIMQAVCASNKTAFYINDGFDFANGKRVVSKIPPGNKTWNKPTWTKYYTPSDLIKGAYEKYDLSYDKPLITYYSGTGYVFSWFQIIRIPMDRPWWKFWKHRYYILRYRPEICWDGTSCYHKFFQIIKDFSPPRNEVRKMYYHCIDLDRNFEKITSYLQDRYDHYNFPRMKQLVSEIFKTGNEKLVFTDNHLNRSDEISRYVIKHRKQYPEQLPDIFLKMTGSPSWYAYKLDKDNNSFMMLEYFYNPSRRNALYLALDMTKGYKYGITLSNQFNMLSRRKLLKKFKGQVMPDDMTKLPSIPKPVSSPSSRARRLNIYYEDTYLKLPEREVALQMTFNAEFLRQYWKKILSQ
jgi:hypothetical protein